LGAEVVDAGRAVRLLRGALLGNGSTRLVRRLVSSEPLLPTAVATPDRRLRLSAG
jgi:hypothetical protein